MRHSTTIIVLKYISFIHRRDFYLTQVFKFSLIQIQINSRPKSSDVFCNPITLSLRRFFSPSRFLETRSHKFRNKSVGKINCSFLILLVSNNPISGLNLHATLLDVYYAKNVTVVSCRIPLFLPSICERVSEQSNESK